MFHVGQTYRMKTYIHDFLDTVTVVGVYTENGTWVVDFMRNGGRVYHMTQQEIECANYCLLNNGVNDFPEIDDETAEMTEFDEEDVPYEEPDEDFVEYIDIVM